MADAVDDVPAEAEAEARIVAARRRRWPRVLAAVAIVLLGALAYLWATREDIADNIIASQLQQMGVPATYKIERIGPSLQILNNIVIGDPQRPDVVIERIEVEILPRFGFPRVGQVRLIRPQFNARIKDGAVSLGSLDKVLYGGPPSAEAFRLPDMDLAIEGGSARLDGPFGRLGAVFGGRGNLRDGFVGAATLAAPALSLDGAGLAGCSARKATAQLQVRVTREKPHITGPVRLASLMCPGVDAIRLGQSEVALDATLDPGFDGGDGTARLAGFGGSASGIQLGGLGGQTRISWRKGALTAAYDLALNSLVAAQGRVSELAIKGQLRGGDALRRLDADGTLGAKGIVAGSQLDAALAETEKAGAGTLVADLVGQMRRALLPQLRGASLVSDFVVRRNGAATSLVLPEAKLTGSGGAVLLALSRFQMLADARVPPRISGNFSTGGPGLPRLTGRLERGRPGMTLVRMSMAHYAAGSTRLALPELVVAQGRDGTVGFSGRLLASGNLPGGRVEGLALPLDGRWEPGRKLFVWRGCRDITFTALTYSDLKLGRQALQLCPAPGQAMLQSGPRGLQFSANAARLDLRGMLGSSPIHVRGGPVGLGGAGKLAARTLVVELGRAGAINEFKLAGLTAEFGKTVTGTFTDTEARLSAVPLDLIKGQGTWSYTGGVLSVAGGQFELLDREQVDRFNPLIARDATLTLKDGIITALAALREPKSDRLVAEANIAHNLGDGTGFADLRVPDLRFDPRFQPVTITNLLSGVIANATGLVTGTGRIDWNAKGVTSSGRFRIDDFDFAAAFGGVKGVSGTVVFTDLLGMVTAPDQTLKIALINPGIEVVDGVMTYDLRPGQFLVIRGAKWPFLDGTLELLPTHTSFGVEEVRRYTLRVTGISAARFVEKMELGNISATGLFDGDLPLVFDENGGRIEGGLLRSRAPGGTLSYVGELTYKDLSAMGNFAFQTLRALEYKAMRIALDGELQGELVSRVRFDGVTQGVGAKKNLITRQIAKLPIQFNINLRAPFYSLITNLKAMYDPAFVRDPRDLRLVDEQGNPLPAPPADPPVPGSGQGAALPPPLPQTKAPQRRIQPSESEKLP